MNSGGRAGARVVALILGSAAVIASAARAEPPEVRSATALGQSAADLVFTPVRPCRIIDTRAAGGPIPAGGTRDFVVAGPMSGQGGAADCGVPPGRATAVAVNFVAVNPAGAGDLRAWAFGQTVPAASVVNYVAISGVANFNIANALVLPICDPHTATCTKDFTVQADVSGTHLVADVMGYFSSPFTRTVYVSPVPGDNLASGLALRNALAAITPTSCPGVGGDRWVR